MKFSAKGVAPSCLTGHCAQASEDWAPDYENFREKRELLNALLQEQGYVCAYCGRAITGNDDSHIDHYHCQQHFPERRVDYANLFASCGPPRQKHLPSTCGDAKGGERPPDPHILPSESDCEARFIYGPSGTITARDAGAKNMVAWLKLDDPSLVLDRATVLLGIEKEIADGTISPEDKQGEILSWRTPDGTGRLKSLAHVAARYLEDEL